MDLPDCIEVWSFSTTSPSWMMSCLTLMPVISSNAFASVLDSYSCVVMVSETTEISLTPFALSFFAASMNHFISACCLSLLRVDGWNSLSIHFFASASPAQAVWPQTRSAAAAAIAVLCGLMVLLLSLCSPNRMLLYLASGSSGQQSGSTFAQDQREHQKRCDEADPDRRFMLQLEPYPDLFAHADEREIDVRGGEQADEQAVAPGRRDGKEAAAQHGGGFQLPHRHAREHQEHAGEEDRHRQGPYHPVKHRASTARIASSYAAHREALGDVVAHEPDHHRSGKDRQHAGGGEHAPVHSRGRDGARHRGHMGLALT